MESKSLVFILLVSLIVVARCQEYNQQSGQSQTLPIPSENYGTIPEPYNQQNNGSSQSQNSNTPTEQSPKRGGFGQSFRNMMSRGSSFMRKLFSGFRNEPSNQANPSNPQQNAGQAPQTTQNQQSSGLRLDGLIKPLDNYLSKSGLPIQLSPITQGLTETTNVLTAGVGKTLDRVINRSGNKTDSQ